MIRRIPSYARVLNFMNKFNFKRIVLYFFIFIFVLINAIPSCMAESSSNIFSSKPHILFLLTICVIIFIIIILIIELAPSRVEEEQKEDETEFGRKKTQDSKRIKKGPKDDIEEWKVVEDDVPKKETKPLKGKSPGAPKKGVKGTGAPSKLPKKGKMPKDKVGGLKAAGTGSGTFKPIVTILKTTKRCNICLGAIKPGLEVVKCRCDKYYHLSCASRVEECPVCSAQYDKAYFDKVSGKGKRPKDEIDFPDIEDFDKTKPKKGKMPIDELKLKLARGEIDHEQYKEMKRELE